MPQFLQRFAALADIRLHYAEMPGRGRPLILLHGIGMDWRVWQAVSRRLEPWFNLFALDLRGHGESDKPAHGYSLAHYAADIEDFIEALQLQDVVLVGSSLGGMVAAAVEAPPDVVSYRILADPPLTGGPIRDVAMFQEILQLKNEPTAGLEGVLSTWNPGVGKHLVRTMAEMWHEAADGVILDMLAHPTDYYAIEPALRANESATLIMRADEKLGAVLGPKEAERAAALLPHGSVVQVAGSGHAIHAYRPKEFVRLIAEFIGVLPAAVPLRFNQSEQGRSEDKASTDVAAEACT